MRDILHDLAAQQDDFDAVIVDLDEEGWLRPSRCEGWSVADVVAHMAQTNELAAASVTGRLGEAAEAVGWTGGVGTVDDLAESAVVRSRGVPGAQLGDRVGAWWRQSAADQLAALTACDPSQRVPWVSGSLSARTLAATRLSETWIHTGDIAAPFGIDAGPTDRLRHIARLAWRTLPYAFAREGRELTGPVAVHLVGPNGDRWDFVPDADAHADADAVTAIEGDAHDWCLVAARRVDPATTTLRGTGPDVDAVLELVRTYA